MRLFRALTSPPARVSERTLADLARTEGINEMLACTGKEEWFAGRNNIAEKMSGPGYPSDGHHGPKEAVQMIDLRSDTITQPTPEMREAMFQAELGDDVYGEDPTVNRLEEAAAAKLGKEAGLFTASGTMGNLIAIMTHTQPGDEIFLDAGAHIYYYEVGGLSRVAGLVPHLIHGERGMISRQQLEAAVRPDNIHFPEPKLLCLENTHNRAGGRVLPQDQVVATTQLAQELGLRLHLDGARLFNAAAASQTTAAALAAPFDSVMVCLSKGLAAPVGSVVVGSGDFIARARKIRKVLGGGMRQAGVLAAAGLWALEHMTDRLQDDHQRAQALADGLAAIPGLSLQQPVETNMLYVRISTPGWDAAKLVAAWQERGICSNAVGSDSVRLVTHWQIDDEHIRTVIQITEELLAAAA